MTLLDNDDDLPALPEADLGRLYVGFACKTCKRDFPVHILRETFEDPDAMMRCRPPCPRCDRPGILHKKSSTWGSWDGGLVKTPTSVTPYFPPDPNEPKRQS